MEILKRYITTQVQLSEEDLVAFCNLFTPRQVRRKSYLLQDGEICKFEAFVTNGCFRVYHSSPSGDEQVLYFATENWWVTDIDSFTNIRPSELNIEALEDSEVLLISKKDKELAYQQWPEIERLFRIMTQRALVALQRRMIDNLSKTADERYIDFMERYPGHYHRLSNVQIAAYLGISHEFVSKIRRKIARKN